MCLQSFYNPQSVQHTHGLRTHKHIRIHIHLHTYTRTHIRVASHLEQTKQCQNTMASMYAMATLRQLLCTHEAGTTAKSLDYEYIWIHLHIHVGIFCGSFGYMQMPMWPVYRWGAHTHKSAYAHAHTDQLWQTMQCQNVVLPTSALLTRGQLLCTQDATKNAKCLHDCDTLLAW